MSGSKKNVVCLSTKLFSTLRRGQLLDVVEHPNQEKYAGQRMFVINVKDYVYLVPFVENENEVFLKTIIPSRKATR